MKQGLMLLALCLAGMVSAASVQWGTNAAVGAGKTGTLTDTTAISQDITGLTIKITGMKYTSWVATQTGQRLFTVYGKNGTAGANGITTGGTDVGGDSATTSKSYFDFFVADNGELGWGLAGNKGGNSDKTGYKGRSTGWKIVDLFDADGNLTLTFTKTGVLPINLSLAQNGDSVVLENDSETTHGFGFNSSYVWDRITVTELPEPGVLTLLALGVAGLALRRKVA